MNVVKCVNGHFFDGEAYTNCPICGASLLQKDPPLTDQPGLRSLSADQTAAGKGTNTTGTMKLLKCKNGHFFDAASYQFCPQCGAPAAEDESSSVSGGALKKKKCIFGKKKSIFKKKNLTDPEPQAAGEWGFFEKQENEKDESPTEGVFIAAHSSLTTAPETGNSSGNGVHSDTGNSPETGKTLDFWTTSSEGDILRSDSKKIQGDTVDPDSDTEVSPTLAADDSGVISAVHAEDRNSENTSEDLLTEVRKVSASDEGKTLSYFSSIAASGASDNKESMPPAKDIDPVVGWLVAIAGPHLGESFAIFAGTNSIGRGTANRIVLDRDPAVSKEKHALLTYEPKHRYFYIKPGDSKGLVYCNDEYISESCRINARDVIEAGNTKLVFIPFCTEDFSWEEILQ